MPSRKTDNTSPIPQSRMQTRASNSNKHPGAVVLEAASRLRRDPAEVQIEKETKKARKDKKEQQVAQEEAAESELEGYRLRQKTKARSDEKTFPRHGPSGDVKGGQRRSQTSHNVSQPTTTNNQRNHRTQAQEPVRQATPTANRKRKSVFEIAVQPAGDDEQIVAPSKKTKTALDGNAPVKRPIPRPIPRQATFIEVEGIPVYSKVDKAGISEIARTPTRRASRKGDIPGETHGAERLRRTETMVESGINKELIQRRPHMEQSRDSPDVEMEDMTPKAREFQPNADDLEPYETPMILKRRIRRVIEDSDTETHTPGKQISVTDKEDRRINTRNMSETKSTAKSATAKPAVRAQKGDSVSQTVDKRSQRTTALNRIAVTKEITLDKNHRRKVKIEKMGIPVSFSDEDDSFERDVALNSPEKGKDFRKSSKTQIKVKQDSKRSGKKGDNLIPFPKAAEPLFSTVALPLWVANYYSQGDGWKTPGERHRQTLQDICNRVYGDSLTLQVTEDTEAWKKACTKLWDYRSRMRARAMQAVEDAYTAKYGADSLQDAQQRIEFGEWLCSKKSQVFQFKGMLETGKAKGQFESTMIIQTMSIHYTLALPKKNLKNFEIGEPEVAYALATAACERALALWRDDLLKYENNTLKMTRTSVRHDFSGTNYRSCTLGWLAGIQQKRRADKKFFDRVCDEAREIAQRSAKGKLVDESDTDNQHSDCEIADRAAIQSDESDHDDEDPDQTGMPGPSQGHEKEIDGVEDNDDGDIYEPDVDKSDNIDNLSQDIPMSDLTEEESDT